MNKPTWRMQEQIDAGHACAFGAAATLSDAQGFVRASIEDLQYEMRFVMSEYPNQASRPGAAHTTILEVTDYLEGQLAVDRLSDAGFPVEGIKIIGHDMKSVEVVTGRMTTGKATGLGALGGLWFGLFVGLLLGIVAIAGWLTIVIISLILGAIFGAIAGGVGHAMTRGKRDFSSSQGLEASRYEVLVPRERAAEVKSILGLGGPAQ